MARFFDGVDDKIAATITAVDTGDWTMGGWLYATGAGEAGFGIAMNVQGAGPTTVQYMGTFNSATLYAAQGFTTTDASALQTVNGFAFNKWHCAFATYTDATRGIKLYRGDIAAAMAEVTYNALPVAGVGTRRTAGTTLGVGNNIATTQTWAGNIGHVMFARRLLTLDEMERFRQGARPVLSSAVMVIDWPLDSPTAAQAEDLSGNGVNGTVTGSTAVEGPPVPDAWGEQAMVATRAVVANHPGSRLPVLGVG